jgi:hypothetical protein
MNKIFIIGLPRTGTTSASVTLLDYGFKVAHTAYTKRAFELADVISDAPCFCDYKELDKLYPNSKFVYLDRALEDWAPSMQSLLKKMIPELKPKTGYLNTVLKRCMNTTFALLTTENPTKIQHLEACYITHQTEVFRYFLNRHDFIKINLNQSGHLNALLNFLDIVEDQAVNFPHLNAGKQVDAWKELKHPHKINSLSAGTEHKKFLDYADIPIAHHAIK